jgi:hypothetical protein
VWFAVIVESIALREFVITFCWFMTRMANCELEPAELVSGARVWVIDGLVKVQGSNEIRSWATRIGGLANAQLD